MTAPVSVSTVEPMSDSPVATNSPGGTHSEALGASQTWSVPQSSKAPLMHLINRPSAAQAPQYRAAPAPEACFTHRHLREDTQRQKLVIAKLAAAYALDGRGPLETIVSVLRLAVERYMAGGAEELAPELCSLVVACARPPVRQPMVDEAANRRARGELLSTLSRVASSAPAKLRAAAVATLTSLLHPVGWPGAIDRGPESLLPSQSMAVALAESTSAPADAVSGLRDASGEAQLRGACAVLLSMARCSARVRRRLVEADVASAIVHQLYVVTEAEATMARGGGAGASPSTPATGRGASSALDDVDGEDSLQGSSKRLSLDTIIGDDDYRQMRRSARLSAVEDAKLAAARFHSLGASGFVKFVDGGAAIDQHVYDEDVDEDEDGDELDPPPVEPPEPAAPRQRRAASAAAAQVGNSRVGAANVGMGHVARRPPPMWPVGAASTMGTLSMQLLDLMGSLCTETHHGSGSDDVSTHSARCATAVEATAALVAAGAIRPTAAALELSLAGLRTHSERRRRLDALTILQQLASVEPDGPAQLRETRCLELLAHAVGGARGASTRGLHGCTREREDAEMLDSALSLLRRGIEADGQFAETMWTHEPCVGALVRAIDTLGVPPTPPAAALRPGGTRAVLAVSAEHVVHGLNGIVAGGASGASRSSSSSSGGGGSGTGGSSAMLIGWPSLVNELLTTRALEVVGEMVHRAPDTSIPPLTASRAATIASRAAKGDPVALAEAAAEATRAARMRVATSLLAAVGDAARRITSAGQGFHGMPSHSHSQGTHGMPPPPLLERLLQVLTALITVAPTVVRAYAERLSLTRLLTSYAVQIFASPACRGGAAPSRERLATGAVAAASGCFDVLSAMATTDSACAMAMCDAGVFTAVLEGMRLPFVRGAAPHDARLLIRAVDLLAALSADAGVSTWPKVVASVRRCGGVGTVLESIGLATASLLAPLLTLLADWLRSPQLRDEFRRWRAPAGLLLPAPPVSAGACAGSGAEDGADAVRMVLLAWQSAETHPQNSHLVRAPRFQGRPDAKGLIDPLPPPESLPAWRAKMGAADRTSGVALATASLLSRTAPLHARIGALVQQLRFGGSTDGMGLPALPPSEAALLVAAESYADVATSRAWKQCAVELAEEGIVPLPADASRQAATIRAGGARIDGVWSAQHELRTADSADKANRETITYQLLVHAKDANPMNVMRQRPTGAKLSLDQRRRGQVAMRKMLQNTTIPYVADKSALREQRQTQAKLLVPSKLVERAENWLIDGSVGSQHAAAAKLQAAQRGKKAREQTQKKKSEKKPANSPSKAPRAQSASYQRDQTVPNPRPTSATTQRVG